VKFSISSVKFCLSSVKLDVLSDRQTSKARHICFVLFMIPLVLRERITALTADGWSANAISEALGVSVRTINRIRRLLLTTGSVHSPRGFKEFRGRRKFQEEHFVFLQSIMIVNPNITLQRLHERLCNQFPELDVTLSAVRAVMRRMRIRFRGLPKLAVEANQQLRAEYWSRYASSIYRSLIISL